VDEVARRCGFEDPGYFRRIFRRHEQMSPRAYRHLYGRVHVNAEE
jgi:AraC-like DNA-binding protein